MVILKFFKKKIRQKEALEKYQKALEIWKNLKVNHKIQETKQLIKYTEEAIKKEKEDNDENDDNNKEK